jgi:hypothetical protein
LVETLPIECPGSLSCCAYEELAINNSPHETRTAFRDKSPTRFFTSSPVRQEGKEFACREYANLCLRESDGSCSVDESWRWSQRRDYGRLFSGRTEVTSEIVILIGSRADRKTFDYAMRVVNLGGSL